MDTANLTQAHDVRAFLTHTHRHTHRHRHIHLHTYIYTHIHVHIYTLTTADTFLHTHTHTHDYPYEGAHTHIHARTRIHAHLHTCQNNLKSKAGSYFSVNNIPPLQLSSTAIKKRRAAPSCHVTWLQTVRNTNVSPQRLQLSPSYAKTWLY